MNFNSNHLFMFFLAIGILNILVTEKNYYDFASNKVIKNDECSAIPDGWIDLSQKSEFDQYSSLIGCNIKFEKSFNASKSLINIYSCTFNNLGKDENTEKGGAIYLYVASSTPKGQCIIENCMFTECSATSGGAIYFHYVKSVKNVTFCVNNCTFQNNKAENGGAFYIYAVHGEVLNCTFINNCATLKGQEIYFSITETSGTNIPTPFVFQYCTFEGIDVTNLLPMIYLDWTAKCDFVFNDNKVILHQPTEEGGRYLFGPNIDFVT